MSAAINIEATKVALRAKIVELEEKQDEEFEGTLEWESLEDEQCDFETALIRLERGIELGAYQSVIDLVMVQ